MTDPAGSPLTNQAPPQVANLNENPAWADIIADRGWHAWWSTSGVSLADYRAHFEPMLSGDNIPLALVAHQDGRYLGSVLVIDNDLQARPALAPWIAALWVEPAERRHGIAARLIAAARAEALRLGHTTCYLCATADRTAFYLDRGFDLIESNVEGLNILAVSSSRPESADPGLSP